MGAGDVGVEAARRMPEIRRYTYIIYTMYIPFIECLYMCTLCNEFSNSMAPCGRRGR